MWSCLANHAKLRLANQAATRDKAESQGGQSYMSVRGSGRFSSLSTMYFKPIEFLNNRWAVMFALLAFQH